MTDYTKSVNFTDKDGLPPGDTNKILRGTEIDTELSAVQTAVNSKADKASPTFTGTLTTAGLTASGTFTLGGTAITATAAELNFVDGVTENIQTQLNGKQATGSYLTANQTITLSGDATGSGTTGITVEVVNDSHSHSNSTITSLDAAKVSTGTFADARIPALAASKITSGTFDVARIPNLNASKITAGTLANARISQASVTQHQAAINAGQVDGKDIAVVASLPGSPAANTIYFVTG